MIRKLSRIEKLAAISALLMPVMFAIIIIIVTKFHVTPN